MTRMLSTFLEIELDPTWETVDNAVNATKKILDGGKKRKAIAEGEIATKKVATQLLDALQEWKQHDQDIGYEQKRLDDMLQDENINWQDEERKSKKGKGVPKMRFEKNSSVKCNEVLKAKHCYHKMQHHSIEEQKNTKSTWFPF